MAITKDDLEHYTTEQFTELLNSKTSMVLCHELGIEYLEFRRLYNKAHRRAAYKRKLQNTFTAAKQASKPKVKPCLYCGKSLTSTGPGHRLHDECRRNVTNSNHYMM